MANEPEKSFASANDTPSTGLSAQGGGDVGAGAGVRLAELGKLASGLGHELNNPLGVAWGNIQILQRYLAGFRELLAVYDSAPLPEGLAKAIARKKEEIDYEFLVEDLDKATLAVRDSISRAINIVSTLRLFMREHVDLAPSDPRDFCEKALAAVKEELDKHGIAVERAYAHDGPVPCSASALQVVVTNLLLNAVDAMDEPGGRIRVETAVRAGRLHLCVEDSGKGMAPEVASRLFEPFFSTKPAGVNIGIGLALCQSIVARHGGVIRVEPAPGKGTRMIVDLPATPAMPEMMEER